MEIDKTALIKFLLNNKSLSRQQIARRDKLISRDCISIDLINIPEGQDAIARLRNKTHRPGIKPSTLYIDPRIMYDMLLRFNQDPILKYIAHSIDDNDALQYIISECQSEGYNLREHAALIKKRFQDLVDSLGDQVNTKMLSLMKGFVSSNTIEWSSKKLSYSWQNRDFLDWGDKNKGKIPNPGKNFQRKQKSPGYKLPKDFISNINGTRVKNFTQLGAYFKSLYHIKDDNSLFDILTYVNQIEKYDSSIDIEFSENKFLTNKNLFVDVDKLLQAYKKIISLCKDCHRKGERLKIKLFFYENNENKDTRFEILDEGAVFKKTLSDMMNRIGEKQCGLIENQINGLCDLYIEADFGDNDSYRINLWDEQEYEFNAIPSPHGVKYILRFKQ